MPQYSRMVIAFLTDDKGSENANIRAKHERTGTSCSFTATSGDTFGSDKIIKERVAMVLTSHLFFE